jgi:hypothetical protein
MLSTQRRANWNCPGRFSIASRTASGCPTVGILLVIYAAATAASPQYLWGRFALISIALTVPNIDFMPRSAMPLDADECLFVNWVAIPLFSTMRAIYAFSFELSHRIYRTDAPIGMTNMLIQSTRACTVSPFLSIGIATFHRE